MNVLHITLLVNTTNILPFTYLHSQCLQSLAKPPNVHNLCKRLQSWKPAVGSGCGAAFCSVWNDVVMSPKNKPTTRHFVSIE
jgi:hypothetical protein